MDTRQLDAVLVLLLRITPLRAVIVITPRILTRMVLAMIGGTTVIATENGTGVITTPLSKPHLPPMAGAFM